MTCRPERLPAVGDRPRLHFTPPDGWMNDPNGLAFHDGRLHAFFQYQPDAPRWGRMHWGHAASADLITWEDLPIALRPDADGPDADGCWSGSLVMDGATPTILYTGVVLRAGLRRASICLATSQDGLRTWTKAPGGPVIAVSPAGIRPDRFRDPFVWRDEAGWAMLLGAGTTRGRGTVLLYRSDDLRTWRYGGPFLSTEAVVHADPAALVDDIDSPCWECPQLVRLGGCDVLIVSIADRAPPVRPAHVVAFVGRAVGDRFVPSHFERVGLGPDFYAPAVVRAPDGRHLLLGWIPEDPPRSRSSRTWAGCLTLPRVISLDDEDRIRVTLAAEVARFEGRPVHLPDADLRDGEVWSHTFEAGPLDLRWSLLPDGAASVRIDVLASHGPLAEVRFEPRDRRLTVYRTGHVRYAGRDPHGTTVLPPSRDGGLRLRLILDGSTLEVVAEERVTATARLPEAGGGARTVACTVIGGGCRLRAIEATGPDVSSRPAHR